MIHQILFSNDNIILNNLKMEKIKLKIKPSMFGVPAIQECFDLIHICYLIWIC